MPKQIGTQGLVEVRGTVTLARRVSFMGVFLRAALNGGLVSAPFRSAWLPLRVTSGPCLYTLSKP